MIRNEGPVGGPGMQEMLSVTAALVGEGLVGKVEVALRGRAAGLFQQNGDFLAEVRLAAGVHLGGPGTPSSTP